MSRRGTIFTYSVVHSSTEEFKDKTPYVVALVRENETTRLIRIEGYDENINIRIGMEVEYNDKDVDGNTIFGPYSSLYSHKI
jgi:uncharacterized OB-fold protein